MEKIDFYHVKLDPNEPTYILVYSWTDNKNNKHTVGSTLFKYKDRAIAKCKEVNDYYRNNPSIYRHNEHCSVVEITCNIEEIYKED